jgi:glycosyltransferase involved in cell wall biosynthesis
LKTFLTIEKSDRTSLFKTIILDICLSHSLKKLAKKNNYDHVIILSFPYCSSAIHIKRFFSKESKISLMIFAEPYKFQKLYSNKSNYFKKSLVAVDNIYASSDYCACSIEKIMNLKVNTSTIYIGVDIEKYLINKDYELIKNLNIPKNAKIVLSLSRMNREMGYESVVQLANRILKKRKDVYFIMVGADGDMSNEVKKLANLNDNVICKINIPANQKASYYSIADVFIAPTEEVHACMGVSIKEAMAASKSIVASKSGGIPEAIKDGENGFLVDFIDSRLDMDSFEDKVIKLLDDKELSNEVSTKAYNDAVEKFSNEVMYGKYLKMIN